MHWLHTHNQNQHSSSINLDNSNLYTPLYSSDNDSLEYMTPSSDNDFLELVNPDHIITPRSLHSQETAVVNPVQNQSIFIVASVRVSTRVKDKHVWWSNYQVSTHMTTVIPYDPIEPVFLASSYTEPNYYQAVKDPLWREAM